MKYMRKLFSVSLFVSTIFLAAPYSFASSGDLIQHGFEQVPSLQLDSKQPSIHHDLRVNSNRDKRIIVPNLCKTAGEEQLFQLAGKAKLEESFVYLPDLCVWIEVGYNETAKSVSLDAEFVTRLLENHRTIELYHLHLGNPRSTKAYFPAYSDLLGLVLLNTTFLKMPSIRIAHKAVTIIGIIEYRFVMSDKTAKLIETYEHTGLENYIAQNLAYEYARDHHQDNYYASVKSCGARTNDSPEKIELCFPMRVDDFLLVYEPSTRPNVSLIHN